MNSFTSAAITNVAIIILVIYAIWTTHNLWALLGLLFIVSAKKES